VTLPNNTIGNDNTGVGLNALFSNTEGNNNTAIGRAAMGGNTTGPNNTAVGWFALASNTTAGANTAVGYQALVNYNGNLGSNTAIGAFALSDATTGQFNTAIGEGALSSLTTGLTNIAIGLGAGDQLTTGGGNVFIGVLGTVPGENSHTYIRNIDSTTVTDDPVYVDLTTGLLGHLSSSRRYKEEIKPMDNASEALYQLKPVTYRYKKEIDPRQSLDYGLVAEDVAKVEPSLAVRDAKGQIESVRYTAVNAMLLNEFLKEHKKVEEQQATIGELQSTAAQQQKGMEVLTAQLKEQAAQIQKVSAQLEVRKPAPQVVATKP
jgi:Chaperone of endosialidase